MIVWNVCWMLWSSLDRSMKCMRIWSRYSRTRYCRCWQLRWQMMSFVIIRVSQKLKRYRHLKMNLCIILKLRKWCFRCHSFESYLLMSSRKRYLTLNRSVIAQFNWIIVQNTSKTLVYMTLEQRFSSRRMIRITKIEKSLQKSVLILTKITTTLSSKEWNSQNIKMQIHSSTFICLR
jgi:hypothetical protein